MKYQVAFFDLFSTFTTHQKVNLKNIHRGSGVPVFDLIKPEKKVLARKIL